MFGFMKKKAPSATPTAKTKKSNGYYLELDEAEDVETTPVKEVVKAVAPKEKAAPDPIPEIPAVEVKTVEPTPAPIAKNPSPVAAKAPEPTPSPAVVIPVLEAENPPAYLQLLETPRRRPGANMATFKTMAQQVRTTKG